MPYLTPNDPLWQEVSSIVSDDGMELYDLERKGGLSLRVYIDRRDAQVTSGDCSRVCRRLMVFFQAEGDRFGVGQEPEIEVSSPGVNRQLRLPEHFERSVGERVRVTLSGSGGQPQPAADSVAAAPKEKSAVVGELRSLVADQVTLVDEQDGEAVTFPLARVKRAHVDFNFG